MRLLCYTPAASTLQTVNSEGTMSGEAAHIRELESVLRKGLGNHELQLVEYSCRPLMPLGENYGSVVLKVDATIRPRENAKTESLHLVAKTVNATDKTLVIWSELLPKEVFAYERVLPAYRQLEREAGVAESDLIDVAPAYYGSRMSLDPSQPDLVDDDSLLLVENLCTREYYNCNKAEGQRVIFFFFRCRVAFFERNHKYYFCYIRTRRHRRGARRQSYDGVGEIPRDRHRDETKEAGLLSRDRRALAQSRNRLGPDGRGLSDLAGQFPHADARRAQGQPTLDRGAYSFLDGRQGLQRGTQRALGDDLPRRLLAQQHAVPQGRGHGPGRRGQVHRLSDLSVRESAQGRGLLRQLLPERGDVRARHRRDRRRLLQPVRQVAAAAEMQRRALHAGRLRRGAEASGLEGVSSVRRGGQVLRQVDRQAQGRGPGDQYRSHAADHRQQVERALRRAHHEIVPILREQGTRVTKVPRRTTMTGDCGRFVESTVTRDQKPKQPAKQQPRQQQQRIDVRCLESLLRQCLDKESLVLLDRKISSLVPIDESYGSLVLQIEAKVRNFHEGQSETVLHLVAKTLNKSDRPYFDFARCMKKEAYVYHELMPVYRQLERQMNVPEDELIDILPRYVGHRFSLEDRLSSDRVDEDAVLLMENLCLKGFYTCDRILGETLDAQYNSRRYIYLRELLNFAGMDKAHAGKALEALARYHALGIALKQRRPDYFESRVVAHARINSRDYSQIDEGLDSILRMFHDAQLDYRSLLERQLPTILERFEAYRGGKTNAARPREPWATVTHGDFWLKNVLYRKDDEGAISDVKLIDYQAYLFNSPLKDLPHFLYMGLDDRARERDFDALVDLYYDEFLKNLKRLEIDASPFARPAFDEELKRQALDEMPMMILVFKFYVHDLKGKYENSSELMLNVFRSDCCRKPAFRERLLHIVRFYEDRGWLSQSTERIQLNLVVLGRLLSLGLLLYGLLHRYLARHHHRRGRWCHGPDTRRRLRHPLGHCLHRHALYTLDMYRYTPTNHQ
ncbi:unnamed protein product [Trichogramma brassicae]|uniref:CHK kinase-like domain-containing protein n=1 Tax=Trichogramma brassicae TaxID=86971 RepID=A0A6H5IQT1_9HYME|nr:unnamed protein product [Trichogramma brassicae]